MIQRNPSPIKNLFGARLGMVAAADASNRPEADIWLNIGYETGDEQYPLVTLPFGIPIDTQNPRSVRGNDPKFLMFVDAQNGLLEQIQKMAAELAPGDSTIIGGGEGGLVIQLRRRAGQAETPDRDTNPFLKDLLVHPVVEDTQTQAG